MLLVLVIISLMPVLLGAILARPAIAKAFRGLLKDRNELALFAVFVFTEVGLTAIVLALFGPRVGFFVIVATVLLFAAWALRPPAQRR
jgi:sugar phosphate permease